MLTGRVTDASPPSSVVADRLAEVDGCLEMREVVDVACAEKVLLPLIMLLGRRFNVAWNLDPCE